MAARESFVDAIIGTLKGMVGEWRGAHAALEARVAALEARPAAAGRGTWAANKTYPVASPDDARRRYVVGRARHR